MSRIRIGGPVAALLLAAAGVLLTTPDAYPQPKPPAEESDNVVPVTATIQTLPNVRLTRGSDTLKVSIQYAQQASTVYVFPVLVAAAVEVANRPGSGWERFPPDRPLPTRSEGGVPRLRVQLVNLLAEEDTRAVVVKRLRELLAEEGVEVKQIKQGLRFNPRAFRVTLATPGTTGEAGEVSLSSPVAPVAQFTILDHGAVIFDLLPENVARLQAANGEAVLLRDAYLKLSGEMWVRFEKQQYLANFHGVQKAVTSLQNELQSIQPTGQPAPEVFVEVQIGGAVEGRTAVSAAFSQYLVGSIRTREGTKGNLGVLNELADRILGRILAELELTRAQDGQRVAVMLGNMATLSATVGEIKTLARQTKAERERSLKTALDESEARRSGRASEYRGSIGVQFGVLGGKVEAGYANATEDEKANRRKQELETLHRGLDELAKHFDGRLPKLTGIRFDQKALDESVKVVQFELEHNTFSGFGWSPHDWAEIKLMTPAGLALNPELLLRQAEAARARYAEFEQFLGTPEKVKELRELLRDARTAADQAKTAAERVAELERRATPAEVERRLRGLELGVGEVPRLVLKGVAPKVSSLAFSPDGRTIATASYEGPAQVWDLAAGAERALLKGQPKAVFSVAFSPDGKTIATGSTDSRARLWDPATGAERTALKGHAKNGVPSVAFSPDGKTIATGGIETVHLWDAATGAERTVLKDFVWVFSVAFSPDGKTLATADFDNTARLWDAATGAARAVLKGHSDRVVSVAFSPDGKTLATASMEGTARLWSTATGAERVVLKGHTEGVSTVAFSPDGKTLATASYDTTVRLWDAATGAERAVLKGHTGPVGAVSFSPDGKSLATASHDGTLRVWAFYR